MDVPAPVALGEPGEGCPWHWTVVPWIGGAEPEAETFEPEEWVASVGRFVRTVREAPGMDAPVKTESRGAPLAALDEWVRTWTARADTSLLDPHAVLAVWDDALAAPAWHGEPCWFHGDLHEGYLLVRDGRLVAVIDWGAAGRGDPAIELNATWGYLPDEASEAYREAVGLGLLPRHDPTMSSGALDTVRRLIASLG